MNNLLNKANHYLKKLLKTQTIPALSFLTSLFPLPSFIFSLFLLSLTLSSFPPSLHSFSLPQIWPSISLSWTLTLILYLHSFFSKCFLFLPLFYHFYHIHIALLFFPAFRLLFFSLYIDSYSISIFFHYFNFYLSFHLYSFFPNPILSLRVSQFLCLYSLLFTSSFFLSNSLFHFFLIHSL
ncbi:unnamed protein product [Acanthosepion pharaonis]|uniref:Uncharacterized protein n=1 Tax=Acanthosepion pharaonis TaxID=158019 RepID=A0A812BY98_ACAPH|nr:unnamed protein product [Sepia pharaonis]